MLFSSSLQNLFYNTINALFYSIGEACTHTAALLYYMLDKISQGFTENSATDRKQVWDQISEPLVEPRPMAQIMVYAEEKEKRKQMNKEPAPTPAHTPVPASEFVQEHFNEFLSDLESVAAYTVTLSTFEEYNDLFIDDAPVTHKPKLPVSLRELFYNPSYQHSDASELATYCNEVFLSLSTYCSAADAMYLQLCTKLQNDTDLWHEHRSGRITASSAYNLLRGKISDNKILSVTKQKKKTVTTIPSLAYGQQSEAKALEDYKLLILGESFKTTKQCLSTSDFHLEVNLKKPGLFVSTEKPFIGGTPDGILECSCCPSAVLIEVKCPYSIENCGISGYFEQKGENTDSKLYIKKTDSNDYIIDTSNPIGNQYYHQVQLQLFSSNLETCKFIVWTPVDMVVIEIERDNTFLSDVVIKLEEIFKQHILPELVTRKKEASKEISPLAAIESIPGTSKICDCDGQLPIDEPIIICCKCERIYHQKCMNKKKKSSSFVCPVCKIKPAHKKNKTN